MAEERDPEVNEKKRHYFLIPNNGGENIPFDAPPGSLNTYQILRLHMLESIAHGVDRLASGLERVTGLDITEDLDDFFLRVGSKEREEYRPG